MARLSRRVALHVSENGYPTGPSRSPAEQAALMAASVRAVAWVAKSLHVTDYRWFDLRDADSSARSLEGGYGLLRDDYTPKPAFEALRNLVGTFGYQ